MDKCLSCQYFDRQNSALKDGKSSQWGQCRRNAPALNMVNAKPHMIEGVWPHVRDDDWCGEFHLVMTTAEPQIDSISENPLFAELLTNSTEPVKAPHSANPDHGVVAALAAKIPHLMLVTPSHAD